MFSFFFSKNLKNKLILYFLLITIVPAVIISYFYFKNSQHTLEKNMINTSVSNLVYSMDNIENQLDNATQISDWIFFNKNLDQIFTGKYSGYNSEIKTFLDLMDYQLWNNASTGRYIYSILIIGKNGADLRAGDAALIDKAAIQKTPWFKKALIQRSRKNWYGIIANPAIIKYSEFYILPLVRPIIHSYTNREIGWQMIGFKTTLISDLFRNYEIKSGETLLVTDSRGYCIYHSDSRYIGQDLKKDAYIKTILNRNNAGHLSAKIAGVSRIIVYCKSKSTGWSIIKILSSAELNQQKRLLLNITIIILLSSFVFTSFLTVYLSSNLTLPLTKLLRQMKAISAGNFDRDPSIEGEDELGTLGRGVNEMAVNIKKLLNQAICDEQEKRRLELEMLQYQVNPHFLYNTLNSLKMMATIQKADGIKEMVTALGRLIMNLAKNTAEKITLAEEISLLNDYVYIQNIRYKGKIKLDYRLENEACLEDKIIKFTLQPIIENAIFHGIEPKKDAGRIVISISEENETILISVEDDGVGMTPDQIKSVLTNDSVGTASPGDKIRGLSGIGVKNVDERLKLTYGPEFGLSIESEVGRFTRVSLKITREK